MKLDSEQDRGMLLGLIANAQMSGQAVKVIADLVSRIETAEVPEPPAATEDAPQPAPNRAARRAAAKRN